jgi:regulator of replication initiation timing
MSSPSYAIMRFAKYKGPEIGRIEAHNERTKEKYGSNPDIDRSRSNLNSHLVHPPQHYRAEAERQIADAGCRVRSDSIRLVEVLFTVSTGYFDDKSPDEIRTYYERSLAFLQEHQRSETIVSAVIHMDEGTPHMHVTFVPLTADKRLSAKDIIGNRKKLIQWQDEYYEYMSVRYPELCRGESAAQTGRTHMTVQEFKNFTKDIRKITRLVDKVEALMSGANLLNSKSRLEQLVPMVKDLLLRFGKMKTQLGQYQEAFTSVMAENERLKKENEKLDSTCRAYHSRDFSNMSAIQQLEQRCLQYEQQLSAIPAEVVARYSQQQRKAQKEANVYGQQGKREGRMDQYNARE